MEGAAEQDIKLYAPVGYEWDIREACAIASSSNMPRDLEEDAILVTDGIHLCSAGAETNLNHSRWLLGTGDSLRSRRPRWLICHTSVIQLHFAIDFQRKKKSGANGARTRNLLRDREAL